MIGSIIGGIIIGGIASNLIERKRERKFESECNENFRRLISGMGSRTSSRSTENKSVNQKYQRQIEFFDSFRELDNKLARMVRQGYKGVTYLVKGMEITRFSNQNLLNSFKNIRNFRNQLSHDKRKWCDVPAPSASVMSDLRRAVAWVRENYSYASSLTYKGLQAFKNGGSQKKSSHGGNQNRGHGNNNNGRANHNRERNCW